MTDRLATLTALVAIVARLRYLDHWAGVPPYKRDAYVESEWV